MTAIYIIAGYLLVASLIGLIPATLARSKGRSFAAWWAVSVLALGIFTVIPVMMLRTYRCPECREVVSPDARVCWRCHAALVVGHPAMAAAPRQVTLGQATTELQIALGAAVVGALLTGLTMWAGIAALSTNAGLGFSAGLLVVAAMLLLIGCRPAVRQYRRVRADQVVGSSV